MNSQMNIDFDHKPRFRSANFTPEELIILLECVQRNHRIIASRKTDSVTCREKDQTWDRIVKEFNIRAKPRIPRSKKQIKAKYKAYKVETRKRSMAAINPGPPSHNILQNLHHHHQQQQQQQQQHHHHHNQANLARTQYNEPPKIEIKQEIEDDDDDDESGDSSTDPEDEEDTSCHNEVTTSKLEEASLKAFMSPLNLSATATATAAAAATSAAPTLADDLSTLQSLKMLSDARHELFMLHREYLLKEFAIREKREREMHELLKLQLAARENREREKHELLQKSRANRQEREQQIHELRKQLICRRKTTVEPLE